MPFAFDKVTTGIYSFVSIISNVNVTGATIAGLAAASTVMHHQNHINLILTLMFNYNFFVNIAISF